MKDCRAVLAACALGLSIIIIGVFTISTFNYIAFLKEQNYSLLDNINYSITQLKKSVIALESEEKFGALVALKTENTALKKETEMLKSRLNRLCARQGPSLAACAQKPEVVDKELSEDKTSGNRGFLFRKDNAE